MPDPSWQQQTDEYNREKERERNDYLRGQGSGWGGRQRNLSGGGGYEDGDVGGPTFFAPGSNPWEDTSGMDTEWWRRRARGNLGEDPGFSAGQPSPDNYLMTGGQTGVPDWAQGERDRMMGAAWGQPLVSDRWGQQGDYLQALRMRAGGQNLLTDQYAKQAIGDARSAAMSAGMSGEGGYNAGAMRGAMQARGSVGQEMAGQIADMRQQEIERARQELMAGLQTERERQLAEAVAMRERQTGLEGLGQKWAGLGLEDTSKQYEQQLDLANTQRQYEEAQKDTDAPWYEKAAPYFQAVGTALATRSDRRMKTGIGGASGEASQLLDALANEGPKRWRYRGELETNYGPMAQTLAAGGPLAASMVEKDPQSGMLAINIPKATTGLMAALAQQQRQLRDLQKKRG